MILRLITGDTALLYITGQGWGRWGLLIDAAAGVAIAFVLAVNVARAGTNARGRDVGIVAG